ncbi:GPN-loop GTPase 1-like [Pseudopipra pipra]|uniref:GPN-loop GTPase 1-like n=1 Tax=Pseudopipra pipra TaxID=415032 RepID=UPI00313A3FAD
MSSVLCCVCLQTECTPFIHLFREYRPEYERLRKTLVTKLLEKKTKGLEAPCFPSVAVGVPDASGRTNPVAFMSSVLCCVCLQTECTPFIHLFREYRPEYERLRKTLVTKLLEKKTKGLEAPCFPSVAVGVPDASGRTNPVAFMSSVLCCVCLQTECTPFIHLFREYRPEYERLRKTLNPHVNLCLREKAQNKQKREQLEHLWKDMGSVCVQGSTLAGPDASAMGPSELILTRGTLDEEQEERESDADGIDHEGKGMRSKSCLSRNPLYIS